MLEIKKLSVGNILKDFNLAVKDGARHLLRGPNGSGKTSLVQAIIGNPDYPAKDGKIIFDGVDITNMPADERARLGIFVGAQNVPEIPGLSVMTFLKHSFAAHYKDAPMKDFIEKLKTAEARLDIPDQWMGRSVNVGFSGGEKKRLMFLSLLILKPKLAILDEPDSGADAKTQKIFGDIINEMTGTAFLVISHLDVFFMPTETTIING